MCFLCYSAGCCATTPSAVAYGMFSVSAALQSGYADTTWAAKAQNSLSGFINLI